MATFVMKSRALQIISVCLFVTMLSADVHALALTDPELKSSLNQRLDVRIRLLTSAANEMESLEIKVTVLNEGAGNHMLPHLQHELIQDETGTYIKVTTRDAVREPVFRFLVEAIWSTGRYLREYSVLIDPFVQR